VSRLSGLEQRFTLVLLATLGVAMMPLTWEDRRVVWIVLAILMGFSQARLAARRAPAAQPAPARAVPVRARTQAARARQRPGLGRGDLPDVTT
jgi:hypothetical protein